MKPNVLALSALAALLVAPPAAAAQAPTEQQVTAAVQPGERVRIKLADGKVWRGKLFLVRPDAVELESGGRTRTALLLDQIRRIEIDIPDPISDSVKRGAWIGLAVGGGLGALVGLALCQGFGDCAGFLLPAALLGGMGAGIGAGFGALGDALVTDTRIVWPATAATRGPFGVGLVSGPRRLGIGLTVRW